MYHGAAPHEKIEANKILVDYDDNGYLLQLFTKVPLPLIVGLTGSLCRIALRSLLS